MVPLSWPRMWSCSTHGEKNIRSQLYKSQSDGSGTRQFINSDGDPLGWWVFENLLEDEIERDAKGGRFLSDLTTQSVHLDSYSTMNASLAKAPFTEKTIVAMMNKVAKNLGLPHKWKEAEENLAVVNVRSGEGLQRKLDALRDVATNKGTNSNNSTLASLAFCIAVHKIYHQRFMNP
jgi:hypothetical protein